MTLPVTRKTLNPPHLHRNPRIDSRTNNITNTHPTVSSHLHLSPFRTSALVLTSFPQRGQSSHYIAHLCKVDSSPRDRVRSDWGAGCRRRACILWRWKGGSRHRMSRGRGRRLRGRRRGNYIGICRLNWGSCGKGGRGLGRRGCALWRAGER